MEGKGKGRKTDSKGKKTRKQTNNVKICTIPQALVEYYPPIVNFTIFFLEKVPFGLPSTLIKLTLLKRRLFIAMETLFSLFITIFCCLVFRVLLRITEKR